uniref:LAGLIDADG endonuclease n=1 Tax=Metarhizium album TaxID=92629 RepID=A0A891H0C9_9HYPO|nr:LAGLIDADG endonuclease [Metarhizium album]QRK27500.1 LAGLIDADG endonuclease [Metarhizium album]
MWVKLSNSGDSLKILILNHIWKYMSGWSNSSGIVTSQNMNENEMGYRGSKSNNGKSLFVKEQRVDGSWHSNVFKVYSNGSWKRLSSQNPFLGNTKFVRYCSNLSTNYQLSPYTLTGLVDAEGCFRISILKNKNFKDNNIPFKTRLYFQLSLHKRDENLLELLKKNLKVGKIYKSRIEAYEYQVSSIKDIEFIIKFFDRYPLITQKYGDYQLFKEAYELIRNKQHLTNDGLLKLIALKASSNWGLNLTLKETFPDIVPVNRVQPNNKIPNPEWLLGFVSGEGNFMIRLINSPANKLGYQVGLRFQITQHSKDKLLMENIINYLQCGYLSVRNDILDFHVTKFSDIVERIIPFFNKYPLLGVKQRDFENFKSVASIISDKKHLTEEGISKIKEIKLAK